MLSQLWYKNVVDRMRKQWEGTERGIKAGPFKWIITPRPDNVYVNDLPDLNQLRTEIEGDSSEGVAGTIYVPNLGEGYDPHAGSGFWGYLFE